MWLKGGFVENYEYPIAGTACAGVVESRKLVHIPDRLIELFPRDDDLVPLGAVSYLGAPLLDADSSVMGHLSVLDDKPMPRNERAVALFEIFAARAAAECRRLKAEQAARAREERIGALRAVGVDAGRARGGDRRRHDRAVLLAQKAALARVGVQARDRDPAPRVAVEAGERLA